MSKIPTIIGDNYTVLPVAIPSTPAYPVTSTHHIYLRQHAPKIPTENDSRSLFATNLPIDSTDVHIRSIFAALIGVGRVEGVRFDGEKEEITEQQQIEAVSQSKKRKRGSNIQIDTSLPQGWDRQLRLKGRTAVVLLVDEKSVELVLKAARKTCKSGKESKYPVWGAGTEGKVPALGSARYAKRQELRFPDKLAVQRSVDAFMTNFNSKEEERERERKRLRNVPDEDGFVTVVRGGRTGPARSEAAEEKRREMAEKEEKRRKELEDAGFYRWQGREKRKKEVGELVKRFEEDRKRVEGMREKRGRFRPER
ncbi:4014d520-18ac-469b-869d-896de4ee287f [Sclerotinia trifoliorum]|uniref:4014d520-18ac-469b-869d-896de4ee287f n=1 Tax=Sclerotinia trifoliorum TaxID=28548 RepID=A0A8H2ZLQ6_9HELO|nr:4014d520-18ac-469b-869d-896de4ee287f [Sclerotinia trifoliorum]